MVTQDLSSYGLNPILAGQKLPFVLFVSSLILKQMVRVTVGKASLCSLQSNCWVLISGGLKERCADTLKTGLDLWKTPH